MDLAVVGSRVLSICLNRHTVRRHFLPIDEPEDQTSLLIDIGYPACATFVQTALQQECESAIGYLLQGACNAPLRAPYGAQMCGTLRAPCWIAPCPVQRPCENCVAHSEGRIHAPCPVQQGPVRALLRDLSWRIHAPGSTQCGPRRPLLHRTCRLPST
jgi:hypothetical protein